MILVTGASGFLGQAVCQHLNQQQQAYRTLPSRIGADLRWPATLPPHLVGVETVIHLAYPGTDGIGTALTSMADLVHDQLLIDLHTIDACARSKVRVVCVGSVCAYPEHAPIPATEQHLWNGRPEYWNEPYGQAKRMGLSLLEVYRRQYGLESTYLILGNLYGPGDTSGHVIPATIRKLREGEAAGAPSISVWGTGRATREFLFVEDAAAAIVRAVECPPQQEPINIVTGEEVSLADLVGMLANRVGYTGQIVWDPSKPDGQPRRQFSYARARRILGWAPMVTLPQGLDRTVAEGNTR